jgi:hypothetical protein
MKTILLFGKIIGILISTLIFSVNANSQENRAIGIWSGYIDLPTIKLELIYKITENKEGKPIFTLAACRTLNLSYY